MSSQLLVGVLPVVQLLFLDSEAINIESLTAEVNWLLERGANGVATGTVTEVALPR